MKSKLTTFAALALLSGATASAQNLLSNGSFEARPLDETAEIGNVNNPTDTGNDFNGNNYNRNTPITNWIVTEPNNATFDIALVNEAWTIGSDFNAGQLTGVTGLWITSQFQNTAPAPEPVTATSFSGTAITIGQEYTYSLDWGAVTDFGDGEFTFALLDGAGNVLDSNIVSAGGTTGGDFNTSSFSYTVDGTETDLNTSDIGVRISMIGDDDFFAIDNVSLIPEPSAFALIGGALALGFAATRRRR